MDNILVVGLNHKVAPVEVRERLAFSRERLPATLRKLTGTVSSERAFSVSETILLSTCNRTEVYVCTDDPCKAESHIHQFMAETGQLKPGALDNVLYVHRDFDAARHLMRVAAGLDSLVVGENEILGQVKGAYEIAHTVGTTGPILSALFRYATQAGKRVRTETEICRTPLSVATIVVELAEEIFSDLSERTALLIGAGKISALTARELVKAGLRCVLVANRTYERAQKLVQSLGEHCAAAVHFDELANNLVIADIVICSTGAPHIVLHAGTVQAAMRTRANRPLLVADLAVPRDADPEIQDIPGVHLTDIDGLETLVQVRHPVVAAVQEAAESIVCQELREFQVWFDARRFVPLIQALREKADAICQDQVEQTLGRLGDLTPQQQQAIQAMGKAIVGKLLHEPIVRLKEPPSDISSAEYIALVQSLFGLS